MTTEGYVFLHRRILDSDLWALTPTQITVAIVCLLRARWSPGIVQGVEVARGQWLTHYHDIKDLCPHGVSVSQVRHAIHRLTSEKVGFLSTRVVTRFGRRFLLITVCKYEDYQSIDGQGVTRVSSRVSSRVSHGCHDNNRRREEEKNENNNGPPVDNSREGRTDRTADIKALTSDLAEGKALANIALVDRIVEVTGDRESQAYYERVVREVDHGRLERMLGAVKEARNLGEIRKSAGAYLKHLVKVDRQESPNA